MLKRDQEQGYHRDGSWEEGSEDNETDLALCESKWISQIFDRPATQQCHPATQQHYSITQECHPTTQFFNLGSCYIAQVAFKLELLLSWPVES